LGEIPRIAAASLVEAHMGTIFFSKSRGLTEFIILPEAPPDKAGKEVICLSKKLFECYD
jgi:hypothetical protein